MRPCLEVGCPRLVHKGRCARHARSRNAATRARRIAAGPRRIYESTHWRWTRRLALDACGNQCQAIENGKRCEQTYALHGHHDYPGGVEQMIMDGVDPFDPAKVVILCDRHHSLLESKLRRRKRNSR